MRRPGANDDLPVLEVADTLLAALGTRGVAVLVAPPGTGKTTAVPPLLLDQPWATGRILVLEPRRLAARAAATRMAAVHGERVGGTFGYSVRGERKVSSSTRVEVITEGLLVRRLQSDPSLDGVSAVLLDEFHERSLDSDLALALLRDVRSSIRPDLRVVVMSATLDPLPVAALLGDGPAAAPVVTAHAPLHPIDVRYRPGSMHDPLEQRVADVVVEALREDPGDLLVFLPGRPEIRRTSRELTRRRLPDGVSVLELHGSLTPREQDAVVRRSSDGRRRVVLSTSLAETSLTVPGVRVVVDAGRRRTVRIDPRTGLPALTTTSVSRAGAEQRTGRAGRTAPGVSYRLWSADDDRHRPAADEPEIRTGELSALVLQVLAWGVDDLDALGWVDAPDEEAASAARSLLHHLGAVDERNRLTADGRRMADIGFHPRLAAVAVAGERLGAVDLAAHLIAVLESAPAGEVDLTRCVRDLAAGRSTDEARTALRRWRRALRADRSARAVTPDSGPDAVEDLVGRLLLAGYPDRVARRRAGDRRDERGRPRTVFHLRSGGEVAVRGDDPLAQATWLVVADLDAGPPGSTGRIHLASEVGTDVIDSQLAGAFRTVDEVRWDPQRRDVVATRRRALGAITVANEVLRDPDPDDVAAALRAGLATEGLGLLGRFGDAAGLRARVACLRGISPDAWPDWSEKALIDGFEEWAAPWLVRARTRADLDRIDVRSALESQLDRARQQQLREQAPTHWTLVSGRRVPLRYGEVDGEPTTVLASVRLRDAIGTDEHPTVAGGRVRVTVELLSPAGRPVQRTTDLPRFWRGSYAAVRSELRGRYPKHPWPDRPWEPLPAARR